MTDQTSIGPSQDVALPRRRGTRPRVTPATPHLQLDQMAPQALQVELWRRMTGLDGVRPGRSSISAPSSLALHLAPELAGGPADAFLAGTEFAHLHGDGSGSLHLSLPVERAGEAIGTQCAELHPVVRMGLAAPTLVMLYGPRDGDELSIVWDLVQESHACARGDAGRHAAPGTPAVGADRHRLR